MTEEDRPSGRTEDANHELISQHDGCSYATHAGLLHLAARKHCCGITVRPVLELCDRTKHRYVFEAVVYPNNSAQGFGGFGDADPTNVPPEMHGSELRIAETRAVNRALRKAYGVGDCSVEELSENRCPRKISNMATARDGLRRRPPVKLRDQLEHLVREHKLDMNLVKRYAADYCGVERLAQANRQKIAEFIAMLSHELVANRGQIVCQLQAYAIPAAG